MLAMMSFVTRQYAEFTVFTGSKCFGPFSRKHTSCHSTLCASISRQRNKLAQRNKVQKEAHQMYFHAICLTQNRKCAPNGPFSQIRSHIRVCDQIISNKMVEFSLVVEAPVRADIMRMWSSGRLQLTHGVKAFKESNSSTADSSEWSLNRLPEALSQVILGRDGVTVGHLRGV